MTLYEAAQSYSPSVRFSAILTPSATPAAEDNKSTWADSICPVWLEPLSGPNDFCGSPDVSPENTGNLLKTRDPQVMELCCA